MKFGNFEVAPKICANLLVQSMYTYYIKKLTQLYGLNVYFSYNIWPSKELNMLPYFWAKIETKNNKETLTTKKCVTTRQLRSKLIELIKPHIPQTH